MKEWAWGIALTTCGVGWIMVVKQISLKLATKDCRVIAEASCGLPEVIDYFLARQEMTNIATFPGVLVGLIGGILLVAKSWQVLRKIKT